jgi:surfeit locus 1 family protein
VSKRIAWAAVALCLFCGFLALGTWQIHRLAWKLDLVARVEARVHAAAVAAPGPREWSSVTANTHEYLRVRASGMLLPGTAVAVRALTELGSGYWVMTPLRTPDGAIIMINRGFVAASDVASIANTGATSELPTTITGLLRMSEPGGAFLRHNDPAADRWYSRDVQAMANSRGLKSVAPYFIDADRASSPGNGTDMPIGGLTVIAFPNNHLLYAITWYTLALMIPLSIGIALRDERRSRR